MYSSKFCFGPSFRQEYYNSNIDIYGHGRVLNIETKGVTERSMRSIISSQKNFPSPDRRYDEEGGGPIALWSKGSSSKAWKIFQNRVNFLAQNMDIRLACLSCTARHPFNSTEIQ